MSRPSFPEETLVKDIPVKYSILSDGRPWGLALPSPRQRPLFVDRQGDSARGARCAKIVLRYGYPFWIHERIEALQEALRSDDVVSQYTALFAVSLALLCRAHTIDRDEASRLLSVDVENLPRLATDVLGIVFGNSSVTPGPVPQGPDHDSVL